MPLGGAVLLVAVIGGALLRERLRSGTAYASPTLSYLSKRIVEGVVFLILVWTFSPLSLGYGVVYPVLMLGMCGLVVYLGNLPLKI